MSDAAYEELVGKAKAARIESSPLPATKGEIAAAIAYAALVLCDGNVRVKLTSLARLLDVDLHTLTRGFYALNYPAPPKEMQMRIRSDAARRILRDEQNRKIDSIASQLGYRNLGAFSKFFHLQNGISPIDFRRKFADRRAAGDAQSG